MGLKGKGFFIWKVMDSEKGNPKAITQVARDAQLTHVIIKIADGAFPYNVNRQTNEDYVSPVVESLRNAGIKVWGWQYVYGDYPSSEAKIAIKRIKELQLDGFVIDAEMEYKEPGKKNAATHYTKQLRNEFPHLPLALSSYRFPSFHPQLPWKAFLEYCDYNMPQVYWEQSHNPEPNLVRTVKEFQSITPFRPIVPTGPTYRAGNWVPTDEDTIKFLDKCKELKLESANFFSWDECRPEFSDLWKTIADYQWDKQTSEKDITDLWVDALNSGDPEMVVKLYAPNSVHITSARSIHGQTDILDWYKYFLKQLFPNGKFTKTNISGSGNSRSVNWICKSEKANVGNGKDTFGLINNQIAYHYTFFESNTQS